MTGDLSLAHVFVSGRVQGVFFRYTASELAARRGLSGWIRNLPDGRVEAMFQGPRSAVEELIGWCHEGPPAARVDDVSVTWSDPVPSLDRFEVSD